MADDRGRRSWFERVGSELSPSRARAGRPMTVTWTGALPSRRIRPSSGESRVAAGTLSQTAAKPALRCRSIDADDLEAVIRLLGRAFPARSASYWAAGFARHIARNHPADRPRFGFILEADGAAVGVLLTLHTEQDFRPGGGTRCNLSSWYVDPRFRPQAALLDRMAARNADVTYLNVTPAPHTWPLLKANGFVRHVRGQILAVPILARRHPGVSIRPVETDDPLDDLDAPERRLVHDHVGYGCLGFVWSDGETRGALLLQRRLIGLGGLVPGLRIPCLHVIYCRSVGDLARVAAPLGRVLLGRYRQPLLLVDAAGPVDGLPGRFFEGRGVKFTRGPTPLEPGDLAYTELVLFGP